MATLLLSDLHLDETRPATLAAFSSLLCQLNTDVEAIYCLGDLFETWIGDDDTGQLASAVAAQFRRAANAGIRIYFQPGNRDFLLGAAYAERCGMQRMADAEVHLIEGQPTLLMHGDTLCTGDLAYRDVRARLRDAVWQQTFLAQPREQRAAFAANARAQSREHTSRMQDSIMDVSDDEVRSELRRHGVHRLIHGHTHRPALHSFELDGRTAQRWVLGDWHLEINALRVDARGARFIDPRGFGRLD